ncbi:MAG: RNA-binding protein [Burkholderiaceae bacterium]
MFVMFPTREEAEKAAQDLAGISEEKKPILLVTPENILGDIVRTVGTSNAPLPSAGTEADTVRQYAELASKGHHALMIHAPGAEETERAMEVIRGMNHSFAEKYRTLVIQDLE